MRAQVAATGKSRREFDSPMSLEIPLKDLFAMPIGKTWLTDKMQKYSCRGISFQYLVLQQNLPKDKSQVEIEGRITAANTGKKNQLIALAFVLIGDGFSFPLTSIPKWSVETDESKFKKIAFRFPRSLLGTEPPTLRLIANIRND